MGSELEPVDPDNPWPQIGWWSTTGLLAVSLVLGFVVLGRDQQNGPTLEAWTAICRALGIAADTGPAAAPQPPLRTPTRVAWTSATLAEIAAGNAEHGAFVAANCTACHGEQGVSRSGFFPSLAGMDAAAIYKQLDDFRAGNRSSGVMNAVAQALTATDSTDVAAYFATRATALAPLVGDGSEAEHTSAEGNAAVRLTVAGDPARGIPPCTACHGPGGSKLGAPPLRAQQPAYIERQLAAFAQGMRQNDIDEQMRTIATQLTPGEMHAIAELYGDGAAAQRVAR